MADIIKIPSKHIYKKNGKELAENRIDSVQISAQEISLVQKVEDVYASNQKPIPISIAEKTEFIPNYFDLSKNNISYSSYADKVDSSAITGYLTFYYDKSEIPNPQNYKIKFSVKFAYLPKTKIQFNKDLYFSDYSEFKNSTIIRYRLNFYSNNEKFYGIEIDCATNQMYYYQSPYFGDKKLVYYGGWTSNGAYQTIDFIDTATAYPYLSREFAKWLCEAGASDTISLDNYSEGEIDFNEIIIEEQYLYYVSSLGIKDKIYDFYSKEWIVLSDALGEIHFNNAPINEDVLNNQLRTIYSTLPKPFVYPPPLAGSTIKKSDYEGYNAQFIWSAIYNKYENFEISIPLSKESNLINDILQYPDISFNCNITKYTYNADFNIKLKSIISSSDDYNKNLYELSSITLGSLIQQETLTEQLLTESEDYLKSNASISSFERADLTKGGINLNTSVELKNQETIKFAKVLREKDSFRYKVYLMTSAIKGNGKFYSDETILKPELEEGSDYLIQFPKEFTNIPTKIELYQVTSIDIIFKGNVISIDIKDNTIAYGNEGKPNFSIKSNELIQTSTKYKGNLLAEEQAKSIVNSYGNGKETLILTCGIAKYYDNSNSSKLLVDPEKSGNLPMVIPNHSIIVPYIQSVDKKNNVVEVPLSTDTKGNAKSFLVIGREFSYDGSTRQLLYAIENTVVSNIPSKPKLSPPPTISLNGSKLSIIDNSGIAEQYDILVNGIAKKTISATSIDLTTLSLYIGTYKISVRAKSTAFSDSAKSNEVTYVVQSSSFAKISFKIGEENYFGEETMTWYDWVHSGYNTGSWIAKANDTYNNIFRYVGSSKIETIQSGTNNVTPIDVLTPNFNYSIKESFSEDSDESNLLDYVDKNYVKKDELDKALEGIDLEGYVKDEELEKTLKDYDKSTVVNEKLSKLQSGIEKWIEEKDYTTDTEVREIVTTEVTQIIDNKNLVNEEKLNETVNNAIGGIEIDKYVSEGELTETLGSYATTKQMETTISAKIGEYSVGVESQFSGLQKQIDGAISSWYFTGAPTLQNAPAKDWLTDAEKEKHSGDLYYDNDTGYCYRWQKIDGVFTWVRIADEDVSKALEEAENARLEAKKAQDMQIGGRNLAYYSKAENSPIIHSQLTINSDDNPLSHKWNITKQMGYAGTAIIDSVFKVGEIYTVSYFIKKTNGTLYNIGGHIASFTQIRCSIDGKETNSYYGTGITIPNDTLVHYIVVTAKYNGGDTSGFYIQPNRGVDNSVTYDLWDIKVEKGEKATDWTPAWEEYYTTVQTNAQIQETANSIRLSVSEIQTNLTDNYYTRSEIDLTNQQINLNVSAVNTKIDNIQVGGRNLLPKAKYGDKIQNINTGSLSKFGYIRNSTADVLGQTLPLNLEKNVEYTISFYAWSSASTSLIWDLWVLPSVGDENFLPQNTFDINTIRTYYKWTFKGEVDFMPKAELRFLNYDKNGAKHTSTAPIYITDIKIERGNKATEWTPAPEDVETEISRVEGKIVLGIRPDGNGKKYSYLNANADYIKFDSGDLEITSKQFSLDKNGNATFKGVVAGTLSSPIGYIGATYSSPNSMICNDAIGFVNTTQSEYGKDNTKSRIVFASGHLYSSNGFYTESISYNTTFTTDNSGNGSKTIELTALGNNLFAVEATIKSVYVSINGSISTLDNEDVTLSLDTSGKVASVTISIKNATYKNTAYYADFTVKAYDIHDASLKILADGTIIASHLKASSGRISGFEMRTLSETDGSETKYFPALYTPATDSDDSLIQLGKLRFSSKGLNYFSSNNVSQTTNESRAYIKFLESVSDPTNPYIHIRAKDIRFDVSNNLYVLDEKANWNSGYTGNITISGVTLKVIKGLIVGYS